MHKLRDLRTKAGFTQKELAAKLGTTQQTIARWENEHTAIPTALLKDLAALFGRSVDELLGATPTRIWRKGHPERGTAWGTLTIDFVYGSERYPISDDSRAFLVRFYSGEGVLGGSPEWFNFDAFDNRLVFFNPAAVMKLRFTSLEVEPMAEFTSPGGSGHGSSKGDDKQNLTPSVRVVHCDGTLCRFTLNDALGKQMALLDNMVDKIKGDSDAFLQMPEPNGSLQILNLRSVAVIEVPLAEYYARYYSPEIVTLAP